MWRPRSLGAISLSSAAAVVGSGLLTSFEQNGVPGLSDGGSGVGTISLDELQLDVSEESFHITAVATLELTALDVDLTMEKYGDTWLLASMGFKVEVRLRVGLSQDYPGHGAPES